MIDIRMTDEQAKAILWLVANSMTLEVSEDLGLNALHDALRQHYKVVPYVQGLADDGPVWMRREFDVPAKFEEDEWNVVRLDVR